jgi:hypothetical protein
MPLNPANFEDAAQDGKNACDDGDSNDGMQAIVAKKLFDEIRDDANNDGSLAVPRNRRQENKNAKCGGQKKVKDLLFRLDSVS